MVRGGRNGRIMDAVIYTALILLSFTTLYPLWNTFVISFNEGSDTTLGGLTLWPRQFTTYNYEVIFSDPRFFKAISISVARTILGTALSILFTALMAYAIAKKELKGKKFYMILAIITMYFRAA